MAGNSTLTSHREFSATHMSRQEADFILFESADVKLCEAFLESLRRESQDSLLVSCRKAKARCPFSG